MDKGFIAIEGYYNCKSRDITVEKICKWKLKKMNEECMY